MAITSANDTVTLCGCNIYHYGNSISLHKKKEKKKAHISGFTIHHLENGNNICHFAQYDINIQLG